ncbi:hypothetical protein BRM3_02935 [Brachybacterium huguangmaarense]|uniref:Uncharacterized protein n=1 Tax=Brachybacterium huguangmaarense TaxID=1652028 RepID=A0ABY6G432_9MICO|nr:hypothetical protein [Brachybacterium huguangmaarense]UYG17404.1 hypothetical protein BRM3_02935 [Brachybacterium huguangmaarense]
MVEEYSRRSGPWAMCRREAWNGLEPSAAERLVLELYDRVTGTDSVPRSPENGHRAES